MTNGEKIKELFPNIIKYGNILIDNTSALQKNILFDDTWWNAEYKEPTTKNDLGVDAVNRKDVHDMLENLPVTVENKWFNWLQMACMRLAELPPITPQESRWIPVSKRLPDEYKIVMASADGVYPEARYSEEYGWEWACESGADVWLEISEVKAWMPLPKQYEPQESEG